MDFTAKTMRKLLGASALLLAVPVLGCDGVCEDLCMRTRITCEDSCDVHFNRVLDPDGWSYCLQDCGSTHDGCVARCDANDDDDY